MYPALVVQFFSRMFSRKPLNAWSIVSCDGRDLMRSFTCPIPRGSFAKATIWSQSAGAAIVTIADVFAIFL